MADRDRVTAWLIPLMEPGRAKAFTKEEYRQLAAAQLGPVSKAAFDHAWVAAIEETGKHDWYNPKPRNRSAKH